MEYDELLVADVLDEYIPDIILDAQADDEDEPDETEVMLLVETEVTDDLDYTDIDDDEEVLELMPTEVQATDDELECVMRTIIEEGDDEHITLTPLLEMVVNEWQKYVIKQTEAVDFVLQFDEIVVILVMDTVYIDIQILVRL